MTQPPYDPDPGRPQDTPRSFPTYGRPDEPGAQQPGTQWAAPGQPQSPPHPAQPQPAQSPYGQHPGGQQAYGQQPGGEPAHGQPSYGQPSYGQQSGQASYGQQAGQPPYGQQPSGQPAYGRPQDGQPPYGSGYGPAQYPAPYGQAPAAYGYGYGYPGQTGGTNGLATAALATGIGGIFFGLAAPVAIGLGIAALVQLKKRQERGRGMAIAGLVIGSLTTVGYLALFGILIAIGATADDDYSARGPGSGPTIYVDDLAVGECFDDGDEEDEAIRRSCTEAHDGEIISNINLPEGPYPGDKGVVKAAKSGCATDFATYVGNTVDKSELDVGWWTPDEDLWNHQDHLVICAAYGPPGEDLTATVKDSHR